LNKYTVEGNIVDVIKRNIYSGILYLESGIIKEIKKTNKSYSNFIIPGFINSHIHIESTMLSPSAFSEIAVKHGTVAIVSDPDEIANVCGVDGINFMIKDSKNADLKMFFGLPSCVPATVFETSGHKINSKLTKELLSRQDIFFLAEMMDFPGVVYNNKEVHEKIKTAHLLNKKIDGHAPALGGNALKLYAKAGISTDHECMTIREAEEKIKLGFKIQIREGSAAKNFESLYSLIDKYPDMVMLCTDDSHPDDLIKGHINTIVKRALEKKLNLFNILRSVSYNVIRHYNINVGLLQKGDPADFVIIDNIYSLNILKTFINGKCVYDKNNSKISIKAHTNIINNFKCNPININDIKIKNKGNVIKVIDVIDGELFTKSYKYRHKQKGKYISGNIDDDILKIVVVNRYSQAKPAIGYIKNFGLKKGAIAQSISHDSHNIICVGTSDTSITKAINKIIKEEGGLVVFDDNDFSFLELEIAGLMTNKNIYETANKYIELNNKALSLGSKLKSPFMTLSFMSLLVIPELKLSDKGLFDGTKFELTSIFED